MDPMDTMDTMEQCHQCGIKGSEVRKWRQYLTVGLAVYGLFVIGCRSNVEVSHEEAVGNSGWSDSNNNDANSSDTNSELESDTTEETTPVPKTEAGSASNTADPASLPESDTSSAVSASCDQTLGDCWVPEPGTRWQWNLETAVNPDLDAQLFDLPWDDGPEGVTKLRERGKRAFCYINAGSLDLGIVDEDDFPDEVRGKAYDGYPNERWLDIRRLDILGPIMAARMDRCKQDGFDGVQFDNVDGYYIADTGFPLTAEDQLVFNRFLAETAHSKGLSAALENDLYQSKEMAEIFDWVIYEIDREDNSDCFYAEDCDLFDPFVKAGKAVMVVDYEDNSKFCTLANKYGFSGIRKEDLLGTWVEFCN